MFGKKGKKKCCGLRSLICTEIRRDKKAFAIFLILALITLGILVQGIFVRDWNRVFTGALTLGLLLLPPFVEHRFCLRLPTAFEVLAYVFVFSAGVLGEIGNYYQRFAFWDALLHAANGYMFAAFGFCLLPLFDRKKAKRCEISPGFLTFAAFCFSMTVGVLWELFEYAADRVLHTDMQKDAFLYAVYSVKLSADGEVVHIREISESVIHTAEGVSYTLQGYLDIGLTDTMKDLAVNTLGAVLFCIIGYLYLKRQRGILAEHFIPVIERETEDGLDIE